MPTLNGLIGSFVVLALLFGVLERLFPAVRPQRLFRREYRTDLAYWLFTPLVAKAIERTAVGLLVIVVLLLLGRDLQTWQSGFGPVASQPDWLQAIEVFVMGDFIGYWTHRWFHRGRLWPFHAVHHSSRELDWLSSVRMHPFNEVAGKLASAVPFVFLGFNPTVLAIYAPFLTLHAIALHANVPWSFGPLRLWVSSPVFHRWHHSRHPEAIDKNFAGLFPVWDRMFGTLYMPKGVQPQDFGITNDDVPASFLPQLLYPFRRRRADATKLEPVTA